MQIFVGNVALASRGIRATARSTKSGSGRYEGRHSVDSSYPFQSPYVSNVKDQARL